MNDDNDGQVNCFQRGLQVLHRQSLTKRPEPPLKLLDFVFRLFEPEKLDFVSTPKVRVSQVWGKSRSQFLVLLLHREKCILENGN